MRPAKSEKKIVDNRDYNVDAEKEFSATRHKSPNVIIRKDAPGRPGTFADQSKASFAGPGHYKTTKNFGEEIKSFTIGTKSEKKITETAGPGQYDADRASSVTKTRIRSAVITKEKARPTSFANPAQVETAGPGHYDDGVRFDSNVKSFKIGTKSEKKIEMSAGPGQYDAERASTMTKSRTRAAIITKDKARPDTFANKAQIGSAAPGQYDDGVRFNSNVKSFKIGEKRQEKV